jgi:hypothetical protein
VGVGGTEVGLCSWEVGLEGGLSLGVLEACWRKDWSQPCSLTTPGDKLWEPCVCAS